MPNGDGVVTLPKGRSDLVVECLEPLAELKVVLVLGPDQLVHVDISLDLVLREGRLEQLVVRHVLGRRLGLPRHAAHGHRLGEHDVGQLTCHGTRCRLLDLGQIHVQRRVKKVEQFGA